MHPASCHFLMMDPQTKSHPQRRIAIAIEIDHGYSWHHDCYQGILEYARRHHWLCIVDPCLVGVSHATGAPYDGVVGRIDRETARIAKAHGIPVVNHWGNSPLTELPSVLVDDVEAGRLVGEHLLACGYRRFALLGVKNNRVSDKQLHGLTQAVTARGFQRPELFTYLNNFEQSREELSRFRQELSHWLSRADLPIGVTAANSTGARYLAQMCYEIGLEVPKDVGIVVQCSCYASDTGTPSITSIEFDYRRLGFLAAQLLDELLQGNAKHPLHRSLSTQRLIQRDSTDVFHCDDPLVAEANRYISTHCRQTLRVEDVANALHTSESTLRRRFEQVLGRHVKEEIARIRIDHVKALLLETDKPLAQISYEFGFSSPTQFTRFFRRVVGQTPSDFRRKQKLLQST